jgi:hypothetical protein
MLQPEQLRREREKWHARAREFQALAMAARQEFENDDAVWFEQAYAQAREKYAQACRAMEQNTFATAPAT